MARTFPIAKVIVYSFLHNKNSAFSPIQTIEYATLRKKIAPRRVRSAILIYKMYLLKERLTFSYYFAAWAISFSAFATALS